MKRHSLVLAGKLDDMQIHSKANLFVKKSITLRFIGAIQNFFKVYWL